MNVPLCTIDAIHDAFYHFMSAKSNAGLHEWHWRMKEPSGLGPPTNSLHWLNNTLREICRCFKSFRDSPGGTEYTAPYPFDFHLERAELEHHITRLALCIKGVREGTDTIVDRQDQLASELNAACAFLGQMSIAFEWNITHKE